MNIKQEEYIYAVARIRCKEGKLFGSKHIEQMISMSDIDSIKRFVSENGWSASTEDDMFSAEQKELWTLMSELVDDLSCFDFLRVDKDFHNLKASVKGVYAEQPPHSMFVYGGLIDPEIIYKAVRDKDYELLPEYLREAAALSHSSLLQTADGQLCDLILDKACLDTVYSMGNKSSDKVVREYCELFVASANIKIAVRGLKLSRSYDFILKSMTECESLNIRMLALSATKSQDDICTYLLSTDYKTAVPFIKESLSAFEKWCDNYLMEKMKEYKSDPFSLAPLVAYIFAKETEIKAVRLILTAKANRLDDSVIRERIREMYV